MINLEQWMELSDEQKIELIQSDAHRLEIFTDEIPKLKVNIHLIDRFLAESHRVAKVRDHYAARTIFEVLRHESVIQDRSQDEFKICNDIIIPIARVSLLFPALNGLFKFKRRKRS